MPIKGKANLCGLVVLATCCAAPRALAETIDYGSLESLFDEPVTTSATGLPQRASDVAANMTIITADQIRQSGSRSLPEIIGMYVPGVNVMQTATNTYEVGMRGYQQPYNPRLLVLIDGRQVFSDDYSRTPWDNLPVNTDDIRQIEVVKGSSSALFGSNATSGAINIITYSPIYDDDKVATISGGTLHAVAGDATGTVKLGDWGGVKISGGGMHEDQNFYSRGGRVVFDDSQSGTGPRHLYVSASSVFRPSSKFTITSELAYSEKYNEETTPFNSLFPANAVSYTARGGFEWKSPIGYIKNDNYLNEYYLVYTIHPPIVDSDHLGNSLIVSRLEDQFSLGSQHNFRAMVEFRHKNMTVTTDPAFVYQKPMLDVNVYSAGGTWFWQIRDNLSFTNAIRVDSNHMQMGGQLEASTLYPQSAYHQAYLTTAFNSGLVYKPSADDTIRLTYGRGVQNPSLDESGFSTSYKIDTTTVYELQGNPNIKPTKVENYELAYDRKIAALDSTARLAVFYERDHDLIAVLPRLTTFDGANVHLILQEGNVGGSWGKGGEIELKGQNEHGLRWDASYSFQFLHEDGLAGATIKYETSAPQHQLRLNLGYTRGNWEVDVHNQFVTATNILRDESTAAPPTAEHTAPFYTLAARVGYKIGDHFTAAVSGSNLTRRDTVQTPYAAIERRVFLSLTGKF